MTEIKDNKFKVNIRHIQSLYILKTIFSFLNESLKLNLIIYNKELQKKFLVDIGNYKKISIKLVKKMAKEENI